MNIEQVSKLVGKFVEITNLSSKRNITDPESGGEPVYEYDIKTGYVGFWLDNIRLYDNPECTGKEIATYYIGNASSRKLWEIKPLEFTAEAQFQNEENADQPKA